MASNFDRAMAYLEKLPPAISGSGGHDATMRAACECVRFGLPDSELWEALRWYNANRCQPPWSEKELMHKINDAKRNAIHGERIRKGTGGRTLRAFAAPDMSKYGLSKSAAGAATRSQARGTAGTGHPAHLPRLVTGIYSADAVAALRGDLISIMPDPGDRTRYLCEWQPSDDPAAFAGNGA